MDKKEVQKVIRDKMRVLGFRSKGNCFHKIIDDDYVIGIYLDHHPFCKGYYIEYGAIYLPDDTKMPFKGFFDWDCRFQFSKNPGDDLSKYHIEDLYSEDERVIDYFEYDIRKPEELIRELNLNIEKRLSLLYEKSYAVNCYKNNLNIFCSLPEKTILKFIKLGDFDIKEINCLRKKWGYNQILL